MRKSILAVAATAALAASGAAHAGLVMDLNGAAAGGVIEADALDWSQTSFLAKGGNAAIANFIGSGGTCATVSCEFDVLTHARLTGYSPTGGGGSIGLPAGIGEITMVAHYTEKVVGAIGGAFPTAQFQSTGAGWLEFYWSPSVDGVDLTGSGFNNGTLIGRLDGVAAGVFGSFTVTDPTAVALDQSANGNDYDGQMTVSGTGSQGNLTAGTAGVDLDASFFLTLLTEFQIIYQNISIGLPFAGANPSHCFNDAPSGAAVGTAGLSSSCDTDHVDGLFSAQGAETGYTPSIGATNGLGTNSPDFIAQTDFNSAVNGRLEVPEPGSLALVGLALGAAGLRSVRRRKAA